MKEGLSSPHFTEDETEAQVEVKSSRSPSWDVAELTLEPGLHGSLSHDQHGPLPPQVGDWGAERGQAPQSGLFL